MLLHANGTQAMAELSIGMVSNVDLDLIPVTFVIPDLLAVSTNRQKALQRFYAGERSLHLLEQKFLFFKRLPDFFISQHALCDVAQVTDDCFYTKKRQQIVSNGFNPAP